MGSAATMLIADAVKSSLTDKRTWTGIGAIVVGICMPLILAVVCILSIASAGAEHNRSAVKLAFSSEDIPENFPDDYSVYIEQMRESFAQIDQAMEGIDEITEGQTQDRDLIKAVFYSLYFGEARIRLDESEYLKFAECFVNYEERTRTIVDEDGNEQEETYLVAIPIDNKVEVFQKVKEDYGRAVSYEQQSNAMNVWYLAKYGITAPAEGDEFSDWADWSISEKISYYDLPRSEYGETVVELAMSRLGNPYSQSLRGTGSYTDCSYLTMWCYRQLGIMLPGTAAEQARYLVENQLTISKEDLQPGDLVFWSYKPNGRFMNITHVGVYAGNGMVVDASSSKGKVVYRNLFDSNKQVLYGRPQ